MPTSLKQSTASQEIVLGYFVDSTDGNTEETGLTIANTDIKIWKNGAITLANKNSGGATHISNGIYYATLDATDTDTLGPMIIFVHVSGALPVRLECEVLPANVFDSLYSTDKLQVDCVEKSSSALDFTTTEKASINTEVDTALADIDLDHFIQVTAGVEEPTDGSYLDQIMHKDASQTFDSTADSLEALRDRGDTAWITATGFSTHAAADVWTVGTRALTDKAGFSLSASGIDSVWDEVVEGSLTGRQILRLNLSALTGKSSGGGTATLIFRDNADSKARITATVDADGNRTAMTLDAS